VEYSDVCVLDVSDPTAPAVLGACPIPTSSARGVALSGKHAYVAAETSGLVIVDLGTPSAPRVVATLPPDSDLLSAEGVAVSGSTAYVAEGVLKVVDVSDPDVTNYPGVFLGGNVGIGDASPDAKLDIEDANLGYNFLFGTGGVTFSTANTTGINMDTFGSASITSNQGAVNAIELIANAGGIDISTGSGTGDIDILSGDAINLKAGTNGINLSTASFTLGSGFSLNGTTGLSAFGSTATAGTANGTGDVYIERDLEVDGTIYGNLEGSVDLNFTEGSVLFINSSGALAQNNANFFWEDSTKELGLGDTTPDDKLDIEDANLGYNFLFGSGGITFSTATGDTVTVASAGDISLSAGAPTIASGITSPNGSSQVIGFRSASAPLSSWIFPRWSSSPKYWMRLPSMSRLTRR